MDLLSLGKTFPKVIRVRVVYIALLEGNAQAILEGNAQAILEGTAQAILEGNARPY